MSKALTHTTRHAIVAEINRLIRVREAAESRLSDLIDVLDAIDGDAELEPSLGWSATIDQTSPARLAGHEDREDDNDSGVADLDSLLSPEWVAIRESRHV